jgi:pyruvate dehydrogenase E1 component beta subunit
VPEGEYTIPFGVADVKREGRDLTVVATNVMVHRALSVADKLAEEGLEVEVIDPRTLLPLDTERIIESVVKTGRLLVIHEACRTGGWAGEVIAAVTGSRAFDYMDTPPQRLAGKDVPIPYNRELERAAVPQLEDVEREMRAILSNRY